MKTKTQIDLARLLGSLLIIASGNAPAMPTLAECGDKDSPYCICAPQWPTGEIVCSPPIVAG
uniref:Uncharacterized protein n=1 Tax=Candidatus Kentrum sp. LFY TaxID=2126342 RepID=A0A450WD40_9GAMM|nr:MAG: hypothetical protein BECKLFY1418C_GA0070996_101210 [Candidatus Kentron sp. LFY]